MATPLEPLSAIDEEVTPLLTSEADAAPAPITSATPITKSEPTMQPDKPPVDWQTPTAALWLQSRLISSDPPTYRPHGEERPFTVQNLRLAAKLVRLFGKRFLSVFAQGQEKRLMAFAIGKVIRGILPTARIWSSSRLLDIVQESLRVGAAGVDRTEVIKVAVLSFIATIGDDVVEYLFNENNALVEGHVNTVCKRAYLSTQLAIPLSAQSSPHLIAMMYEAGIFTYTNPRLTNGEGGAERREWLGPPFTCLNMIFKLFTDVLGTLSQIYLMYITLSTGDGFKTSLLLIALSLAPTIIRALAGLLRPAGKKWTYNWIYHRAEGSLEDMAGEGAYKQETLLFGLREWVLQRWDKVQQEVEAERVERRQNGKGWELAMDTVGAGVRTSFYVLLAFQVLPTNLSLGSMRLYQDTVGSLLDSLKTIRMNADKVFQLLFYLAAYTEVVDLPNNLHLLRPAAHRGTELLDYESHRLDNGMHIVCKDLSFRYPKAEKDTLRNINLTLKPGTTLAIVGLNGSGKTTLIKALLGLYADQGGSITLNGHPLSAYDPSTIHRRTSCLFQDFAKYSFTLRENVGMGNVGLMGNDEALKVAIGRGGAEAVLEKIGLEGKLSRGWLSTDGDITVEKMTVAVIPTAKPGLLQSAKATAAGALSAMRGVSAVVGRWYGGGNIGLSGIEDKADPITPATTTLTDAKTTQPKITPEMNALAPTSSSTTPGSVPAASPTPPTGHTLQTEQAASLSGGQWQRVALARAFMRAKDADLVIFDEPSASLDPRAEAQLFERIHALSHQDGGRKCSTIYISHRFSSVKKADQIAVVEHGSIIECGNHAELIALGARYAELYNLQKAGFED